jgi:uncharacterized membrane protein YphA (DoxX/SURF4 family)
LLLRITAGSTAVLDALGYFEAPPVTIAVGVLLALAGTLLLLGFLTPLAATVAWVSLAAVGMSWLPPPVPNLAADGLTLVLILAVTAAVILLGPGAFSLDSHLFGRREIVLPRRVAGTLKRDTQG